MSRQRLSLLLIIFLIPTIVFRVIKLKKAHRDSESNTMAFYKLEKTATLTIGFGDPNGEDKKYRYSYMELLFFYVCIMWSILQGSIYFSISFYRGLPFLTSIPPDDVIRDKTITFMKNINGTTMAPSQERTSPYSIDVLIIGSNSNMEHIQAQRETWASHNAVRHFFVSTEEDDVDPVCQNLEDKSFTSYMMDFQLHNLKCKSGQFWTETLGEMDQLTTVYTESYWGMEHLKKKYSNPLGWICVQRRFITALTELLEIYAAPGNNYTIPDYLIFADDDSYVNIDHIVKSE